MWAVEAVVRGLWHVRQPRGFVGGVVEDHVADGEGLPLPAHAVDEAVDVAPCRVEVGVHLRLRGEAVGGVGAAEELEKSYESFSFRLEIISYDLFLGFANFLVEACMTFRYTYVWLSVTLATVLVVWPLAKMAFSVAQNNKTLA